MHFYLVACLNDNRVNYSHYLAYVIVHVFIHSYGTHIHAVVGDGFTLLEGVCITLAAQGRGQIHGLSWFLGLGVKL